MEKSRATLADEKCNPTTVRATGGNASAIDPGISNALEELRLLKQEHQNLGRALAIHDDLAQLALNGAGFGRLATAFSHLVGNPVVIESRFFKTLGYAWPTGAPPRDDRPTSTGALFRDPPARALWPHLHDERQSVKVLAAPRRGIPQARAIAPVVVADEVVGYVSIIERDYPLDQQHLALVRQASLAIGIEFVRQQATIESERKLKGSVLDVFLESDDISPEVRAARAALVGYDASAPQALLLVALDTLPPDRHPPAHALPIRDLTTLVETWARRVSPRSLVAEREGQVVVLLAGETTKSRPRARVANESGSNRSRSPHAQEPRLNVSQSELITTLRQDVATFAPAASLSIAFAPPVRDSRELHHVYDNARRALAIFKLLGKSGQTISTNDPRLSVYFLFDSTRADTRREFVEQVLGPLIAYDQRHRRALVPTLQAYLTCGGNLETTARTLAVHTSTLKYRLQRIAEVSGLDIHNADHRFNADLALRLRTLIGV
jgi:purine catabolism regulator